MGSVDYHSETDAELSEEPDFEESYPPHCLSGQRGQEKIEETKPRNPLWIDSKKINPAKLKEMIEAHDGEIYFRKQKFDCFSNPNLVVALEEIINPAHIVVFGVALDVCVKSAVEGFLDHDYRVSVVKDACRAIDPETGRRLLKNWEQRGTKIISTNQLPV